MSQSRNRRVSMHSREAESGTRAGPQNGNPADFVTNARTLDSKSSNKIPKELRYDLENALVGLCDVWFDEIKPHLVKNNLKVHTGGALNENDYGDLGMAGDHRSGANHGDSRRDLDPGAASDVRTRRAAPKFKIRTSSCTVPYIRNKRPGRCDAFSPTRRVESSAPSRRRPAPCRPTPLPPSEFHNLLKIVSRIKARRKATQKEPQSPPLPTPPPVKTAIRYPRCTACGFASSQGQVSITPLRHQPDKTPLFWSYAGGSQSPPLRTNNLLPSRPQYTSFQTNKSCALNNRLTTIHSGSVLPARCEASKPPRSEVARSQLNAKIPANCVSYTAPSPPLLARKSPSPNRTAKSPSPRRATGTSPSSPRAPHASPPSSPIAKPPMNKRPVSPSPRRATGTSPSSPRAPHASPPSSPIAKPPMNKRPVSPSPRRATGTSPSSPRAPHASPPSSPIAKPPMNKRPVSPSPPKSSTHIVDESEAVLTPWLQRISHNHCLLNPRDQIRQATKNSQTFNKKLRPGSSKITLFPVKHERKKQFVDESSLFAKDLINLIGEKYDARVRVLYQNPNREESYPSVMFLTEREISTTKSTWK